MTDVLESFIAALRANGVEASPAEAIEAHRAAAQVGFADRVFFKDALRMTLAKTVAEEAQFDRCFDGFFRRRAIDGQARAAPARFDLEEAVATDDASGLAAAMESAAQAVGAGAIRLDAQRSLMTRRLLDAMGLRALEARIAALREAGPAERERAEALTAGRERLFASARRFVADQAALFAGPTARRLREQILAREKLTAIAADDLAAMQALVRRLARRLAKRHAARRRAARRGRLDVRATIRRSHATAGVPFSVVWKRKVIDKPRIIALVDVSRSVAGAAAFLLLFLYSLGEAVRHFEAFAFSDRLVGVDDLLAEDRVDDAIALVLDRIGFRPTDYGAALEDFCAAAASRLDRRTTVIILGDARSNFADPRLDLMRLISERTRAIVWLNPEPETYWGQGDSVMDRYRPFCRIARSCNTLAELEAIVDTVLASLPSR